MNDATNNVVIALDYAEARLLRKQGYKAITSAKLRRNLDTILRDRENGLQLSIDMIGRLGVKSSMVNLENWSMWNKDFPLPPALSEAFNTLGSVETPFKQPEEVFYLHKTPYGHEQGRTLVFVAKDTRELVRTADTYQRLRPYRPQQRMDDPIYPLEGRSCLITIDELRLIRLDHLKNPAVSIIYTYHICTTGQLATPHTTTNPAHDDYPTESCMFDADALCWPSAMLALCGEHVAAGNGSIRVVIAPLLAGGRMGDPFFLGLSRGVGYETECVTSARGEGAREFCLETNIAPVETTRTVVMWEGGDDITQLIRFGGLKIYTGGGKRRKVQLRSLGLIQETTVAGVGVFGLEANADTLKLWALTGTFSKQATNWRARDARKRNRKVFQSIRRGDVIYNTICPPGGQIGKINTKAQYALQGTKVLQIQDNPKDANEGGVAHVLLKNIQVNTPYIFNGRTKILDDHVSIDSKRWGIRLMRWMDVKEPDDMLECLKQQPCVIMAGLLDVETASMYAIIRVDDGTEDQQHEAIARFGQAMGEKFPSHCMGANSYLPIEVDTVVSLTTIDYTCWTVAKLPTKCYQPYQREGDYGKPTILPLRKQPKSGENEATRALAYVKGIKTLDEVGKRNTTLTSAVLGVLQHFGEEGLDAVESILYQKCTLEGREIEKTISRLRRRWKNNTKKEMTV